MDWNALAAQVAANFAATGQWFLGEPPSPLPPPAESPGLPHVFSAEDGTHGRELWISDGTTAGTYLLKDINPGPGDSFPFSFGGFFGALGDGRVLFGARDGTGGTELWVTDGTEAGTRLVEALNPSSPFGSDPRSFMALGDGRALFAADDAVAGRSLWVSDGTAGGTHLVSSPTNGISPIETDYGLLHTGEALVAARNRLLLTDGTDAGTLVVKNFGQAAPVPPYGFTQLRDGEVLFRANDANGPAVGAELWISDGTTAGTHLLKDINPGPGDSFPNSFHALGNGTAMFIGFDPEHGSEFWISDGTESGTRLLKDINPGPGQGSVFGSDNIVDLGGGRTLFLADDGVHGIEPWVTDGAEAGTHLVKDINPSLGGGPGARAGAFDPRPFGEGHALFSGISSPAAGFDLWITDGTEAGILMVKAFNSNSSFLPYDLGNGKALVVADDATHGRELWITDGTEAGTVLLDDIRPGPEGSVSGPLVALAGAAPSPADPFT